MAGKYVVKKTFKMNKRLYRIGEHVEFPDKMPGAHITEIKERINFGFLRPLDKKAGEHASKVQEEKGESNALKKAVGNIVDKVTGKDKEPETAPETPKAPEKPKETAKGKGKK